MEMTREQFKLLFMMEDDDAGMEYADEEHASGKSWFEIAQGNIATMNALILNQD